MVEVTEGVPCEHRLNGKAVEAMAGTQGGGGGHSRGWRWQWRPPPALRWDIVASVSSTHQSSPMCGPPFPRQCDGGCSGVANGDDPQVEAYDGDRQADAGWWGCRYSGFHAPMLGCWWWSIKAATAN
uniref:Uncharacterized protein n=1 Tax=Oryza glaberrima TaxID=4538 RepID=I1NYM0_ORYGL